VLVMTEFGRTVAMNGTAGAAFLLGGAVAGGRVLADWPGLKPGDPYAGRDLKPTADLRSVIRAALGWTPKGPGLIADLEKMDYGVVA
jgi:uncharacterized protein (DUF1501 family)